MNKPTPALVTERGARSLPRLPLLVLCAAYILPGVFGREPWRNADLAAFGQMAAIASGRTPWLQPGLGLVPADNGVLPQWLGAGFIRSLSGLVEPALAARLAFALVLALTLAAVWYAAYYLARHSAAQPLPMAFGGEAKPKDYARAIADAALLALIASLGLLQLGHETTPELLQLLCVAAMLYGLAALPYRPTSARAFVLLAPPALAASGGPTVALLLGAASLAALVLGRRSEPAVPVRASAPWVLAALLATVAVTMLLWQGRWPLRVHQLSASELLLTVRQWAWFLWPSWFLALWALWRWRRQLDQRHLAVPLAVVATGVLANLAMNGFDRALLLALPGLACLAAFALPTLKRSTSAAVDWFSMLFFTGGAVFVWFMFLAMQTGLPAQPAANVARLAPGFVPQFSPLALSFASAATLAWLWLLRWRTGRHREALWKSLVLPAGGVALCWTLVMSLWLPVLDYARSARPLVERLAGHLPAGACVLAPQANPALVAALETLGGWPVDARPQSPASSNCNYWVRTTRARPLPAAEPGWRRVAELKRPTDRDEVTLVDQRLPR